MEKRKIRNIRIDIIRIIAFALVVYLHFWSYQGFNKTINRGIGMFVKTYLRNVGMICVPLFLIISGYLQIEKEVSWKHFIGLKRTYLVYLLCCIILIIAEFLFHKGNICISEKIIGILNFKLNPYSWYVEMYLGLYLLLPLLNTIWKSIQNKKIIIFTVLILTILPDTFNIFKFDFEMGYYICLTSSPDSIIPRYWSFLYPITYYFIGCYFHDNTKKHICGSKFKDFTVFIFSNLLLCLVSFLASYNKEFVWGKWQDYSSAFVMLMSVSMFSLLVNISMDFENRTFIQSFINKIAEWTYGAYLLSYLIDNIVYRYFPPILGVSKEHPASIFVYVPIVFVLSILLSSIITTIYKISFSRGK